MSRFTRELQSVRVQRQFAGGWLGVLAWMSGVLTLFGQLQTNTAPLALWDISTRVSTGGGYRGNVLLSSFQPVGSSFFEAAGDVSVIRLSESGSSLTLFVLGELRHYFDTEEVKNEGILYAVARAEKPAGEENLMGGEFQYLYQNQILDVSETEQVFRRVGVVGQGLSLKPYWEHDLSKAWCLKVVGIATRQIYQAELDDYWEGLVRLDLAYTYGQRSSVTVSYELRHRFYDTREQYDLEGTPVSGTDLVYRYHEIGGEWRHYWDSDRRWRTTFRAGFLRSEDNGQGYFNYDRAQVSAQMRWQQGGWEAALKGLCGWYWYPNQAVLGDERNRSSYALELRVERAIDEHWLLYAAAGREWNISNNPLEEYDDWVASAGLGLEL
ncbi:MAG: hypothetical protein MUC91_11910 [Verrucomicrobia bacterium]|jgi:hypothetical protein|nr:hypothetical protein [Verrucomicrobiota bacterium]